MNTMWKPLLLAVAVAACSPPVPQDAAPSRELDEPAQPAAATLDSAEVEKKIDRYFKALGQIPPGVELSLEKFEVSARLPGLHEGKMKLSHGEQTQEVAVLVSDDGRWLLATEPIDLSVDPVAKTQQQLESSLDSGDPWQGKEDADIVVVEFSDFQCPFCARADEQVKELMAKHGKEIKFIYKQFPLVSIHPWAQPASEIGLCVLKDKGNDAYWKYHTGVFEDQQGIPGADAAAATEKLLALAGKAGADPAAVKKCFEAHETRAEVEETLKQAEALEVNSTPTFFVNGRRVAGAVPIESFEQIFAESRATP